MHDQNDILRDSQSVEPRVKITRMIDKPAMVHTRPARQGETLRVIHSFRIHVSKPRCAQ